MDPDPEMVSSWGYTMQGGRWSNSKEDGVTGNGAGVGNGVTRK